MPAKKDKIKIICGICKKEFYVNPFRGSTAQYCSKSCSSKGVGRKRYANLPLNCKCSYCGKIFHRVISAMWENNFCSKSCYSKHQSMNRRGINHPRWKGGERNRTFKRYSSPQRSKKGFALTRNEFLSFWQKPCHYCGSDISTIGLDRIDNNKGYELSNVVPCCDRCNRMKLTMAVDDFMNHIYKIYKHSKKGENIDNKFIQ